MEFYFVSINIMYSLFFRIVHTKVLYLGEGDQHHHHRHNHGHNHLHQHGHHHGYNHLHIPQSSYQWSPSTNAVTFPRSASHNVDLRYNYPEDYSKFKYGFQKDGNHYSNRDEKYSVPVEKSPWKPVTNIMKYFPKGYVPLNYLGLDAEKVASVVKTALNEIQKDKQNSYPTVPPRYPTGIQDLIGRPVKPQREIYRGAVFYDEDDPTGGGWRGSSTNFIQRKPTSTYIGQF